jgi:hypothetical protein
MGELTPLSPEVGARIGRLSTVSVNRLIEPDVELAGEMREGAVLPRELLSIAGLDLDLTPEQLATLSRAELSSLTEANIRFEAALTAAFMTRIATTMEVTDVRANYLFHEIGEETRHSRLFIRMLQQLDTPSKNPLHRPFLDRLLLQGMLGRDVVVDVIVLAGEEMTDFLQKRASEHPDTDPFVVETARYHRQEEARHVAFARMILPVDWADAKATNRFLVRHAVPLVLAYTFAFLVHPGVYGTVGLPRWGTWRAVNKTPEWRRLRHASLRPLLDVLLRSGVLREGRIPRGWRWLVGVDRSGRPADQPRTA